MSRKRWFYRLSRLIPVKDGSTLRTLDDVRMFMLDNLPEEDKARRSWQKACEILLAAADGLADVGAVTRQVELALALAGQADGNIQAPDRAHGRRQSRITEAGQSPAEAKRP